MGVRGCVTRRKIQQVMEMEPKRPEAASRGVRGTDSPAVAVPSDLRRDIVSCERSAMSRRGRFGKEN